MQRPYQIVASGPTGVGVMEGHRRNAAYVHADRWKGAFGVNAGPEPWWNTTFYLTARGLTTSAMPAGRLDRYRVRSSLSRARLPHKPRRNTQDLAPSGFRGSIF